MTSLSDRAYPDAAHRPRLDLLVNLGVTVLVPKNVNVAETAVFTPAGSAGVTAIKNGRIDDDTPISDIPNFSPWRGEFLRQNEVRSAFTTVATGFDIVGHFLIVIETGQASLLNRGDVHEHIV